MEHPEYDIRATLTRSEHTLVSRAVRRSDGRSVILKSLAEAYPSLGAVRQLELEYRILRKLEGPGIIAALDLIQRAGSPVLVLEDIGGQSLAQQGRRWSADEVLLVADQVARALGFIHAAGVIHKDIKPHNLVMNWQSGVLKLIDFQLATELPRERHTLDPSRRIEGSLPYMSPEQTGRMNRSIDYRTDYYSLGVTLFELLTGQLPFTAEDITGWVHAHISKQAPAAEALGAPAALSQVIAKLMAKDADARYQSARGLLHDLGRCRENLSSQKTFVLGEQDTSERFRISERLLGRERELDLLLRAFDEASQGSARLLLVGGSSGVGKTALIREVHKPIVAKHGTFVWGKFDQLERNVPYGALAQALRQLVRRVLSSSDAELATWRERLLGALGSGARVLVDWLPELEGVLGPQPPAPQLNPSEAQHRFKRSFVALVRTFARREHPLVIFLDDLQWADASSPGLLVSMLESDELQHVLVIGTYRDNEVDEGHLLSLAMRRIRETRPQALSELCVEPLSRDDVTSLCSNALRRTHSESAPLAALIHEKTGGNPFFATELLAALHRSGAISRSSAGDSWSYDLEAARRARVADNVVELMVARLEGLAPEARHALSAAACLNNQFSLASAAALLGRTQGEAAQLFLEPVARGLIVPQGNDYRLVPGPNEPCWTGGELDVRYQFQHDRVQQACRSLLSDEQRAATHLAIGRALLTERRAAEEIDLFDVTNHLNSGRALIDDERERARLLELNLLVGEKAKAATAFGAAAGYLDVAVELLGAGPRDPAPEQRFDIEARRAECVLLSGDPERAGRLCAELAERAPDALARAAAYLLEARVLEAQARFVESVEAIRRGLGLLDIAWPADMGAIEQGIGHGIARMQEHLSRTPPERLIELPALTDPAKGMAMRLLFQAIPAAIQTCPPLFILAELIMFDIANRHGLTPASAKNFVDCGIIQGGILGDHESAYRLGQVAFRVIERFDAKSVASGVNFVFGAYVSSWRAPHEEALAAFTECYRVGMETGDVQHMGFGTALRLHRLLHIGHELDDCKTELDAAIAFFDKMGLPSQRTAVVLVERALARLCDPQLSPERLAADEAAATARVQQSNNPQWIYAYAESQMVVSVLLGELDEAERWRQMAEPHVASATGLVSIPEYHLIAALLGLRRCPPEADASAREPLLEAARQTRDKLAQWSAGCPENFAHELHLLNAELARAEGQPLEVVLRHYQKAADSTKTTFIQWHAFALEAQARFLEARDQPLLAQAPLGKALALFSRWGARQKVARLERELRGAPRELASLSSSTHRATRGERSRSIESRGLAGDDLDLASIIKATVALSSEVRSESLFASLMRTLLENAGAEHGCLIAYDPDTGAPSIEAEASVSSPPSVGSRPLTEAAPICLGIVQLAARSREPLVIDDAAAHPECADEPIVRARAVRSVLCLPIVNQGKLIATFYAENNATARAFSPARVATLRLIASQAAISIENSRLYAGLERRVEDRTRELATKNREMTAMLDAIEQGVFSIDAELCIRPQYSRSLPAILGATELAGRAFAPLLFEGSSLGSEARAATEAALAVSFGVTPELASVNFAHLVRELSRPGRDGSPRQLEIDWSPIAGSAGTIDSFLVVVRDVTLVRQLRAEQSRSAREAELVERILSAGVDQFRDFCDASRRLIDDARALAAAPEPLGADDARRMYRWLHTIKGNARALGLTRLVEEAHDAEALLERGAPGDAMAAGSVVSSQLEALVRELESLEELARRRLGPLWHGKHQRLEQALAQIEAALEGARPSQPAPALAAIGRTVRSLQSLSLGALLADVSRSVPSLAAELGKPSPRVYSLGDDVSLSPEWARVMRDVFMHALRNALDHGIEPPAEREARGKAARGEIQMVTECRARGVRIRVFDDGRGLAIEQLRRSAAAASSDEALAESVFTPGITTARVVSQISGRGVGMDAVRNFVQERGGAVSLEFTGEEREGYRPFQLVIDLPEEAALRV